MKTNTIKLYLTDLYFFVLLYCSVVFFIKFINIQLVNGSGPILAYDPINCGPESMRRSRPVYPQLES